MTCEGCGSKVYCVLRSRRLPIELLHSFNKCRDICPCQECLIKSICEVFCDDRKYLLDMFTELKCAENIITELVQNGRVEKG